MLEAFDIVRDQHVETDLEAVLTYEERQKSRYRTELANGTILGWFIERGNVLSDGDYLRCQSGELVRIVASPEQVSQIVSADQLTLTRAAYHLGNRHVPLQIGCGFLRYQHDHVLDEMVQGLGLTVSCQMLPFHPENGAYHSSNSHHSHHHSVPDA